MMNSRRSAGATSFLLALIMAKSVTLSAAADGKNAALSDQRVRDAVVLRHDDVTESSGLAASHRQPGLFWTHNDSGSQSKLFAFDRTGRNSGACRLKLAAAIDWEDMASFVQAGQARLIVADCGDNRAKRDSISLYVFDEPDPQRSTDVDSYHELIVTYPDGACDCEAIAVDPRRRQIVLIAKRILGGAPLYVVPLPDERLLRETTIRRQRTNSKLTATRIGTLPVAVVSAMDIDAETGDIWVVNYLTAYRYRCRSRDQRLQEQLAQSSESIPLPRWKQIEAVAVDQDRQIWITCEGKPAMLGRLNTTAEPSAP